MRKNEKSRAFTQEEKDAMPMRNDAIDKLRNTDSTGYWQMPNESDKYKKRGPSKNTDDTGYAKVGPSITKKTGPSKNTNDTNYYYQATPAKTQKIVKNK